MIRPATRVLVALALLIAAGAAAQHHLTLRRMGVRWVDGAPQVTFSARDLVSPRLRRELSDGTRQRVALTIQAYRAGSSQPIASRRVSCNITYDVFARSFVVRMGRRSWVYDEIQEVLDRCLVMRNVTIGSADRYRRHRGRPIFFAARAEFNPINRRRCRQLLRGSASENDLIGPVVITILRREICSAERAIEFRSQDVRGGGP